VSGRVGGAMVSHVALPTPLWVRLDRLARERCPDRPAAERQRLLVAAVEVFLASPDINGRLL
jgi:hypothetical protein